MTTSRDLALLTTHVEEPLSRFPVNLARVGYLLMAVGLALVKWPLFLRDAGVALWKLIWLTAVALPHLLVGDLDAQIASTLFNVSLVVVIVAVTPWDHVWKRYVSAPGTPWRRP
jgi:hypothetical protein